jgi:hypothetical protein
MDGNTSLEIAPSLSVDAKIVEVPLLRHHLPGPAKVGPTTFEARVANKKKK